MIDDRYVIMRALERELLGAINRVSGTKKSLDRMVLELQRQGKTIDDYVVELAGEAMARAEQIVEIAQAILRF